MRKIWLVLILLLALTACGQAGSGTESGAAQAVENYYKALEAGDDEQMAQLACASWEEQALLEFDSFQGVEIVLEDFGCTATGQEGDTAQVKCTGQIAASYGNEQMEFPLSERVHQVQREGGDWRVCGY